MSPSAADMKHTIAAPIRRIYRVFRRPDRPAMPMRGTILMMVAIVAIGLTLAIVRVSRRHEIVRLGYDLSKSAERLRSARDLNRRLELERATLTAPERIRGLATELGMVQCPPELIRVVSSVPAVAVAGRKGAP